MPRSYGYLKCTWVKSGGTGVLQEISPFDRKLQCSSDLMDVVDVYVEGWRMGGGSWLEMVPVLD